MSKFLSASSLLIKAPKKWLITGVAGFIGSNLLQKLLELDQVVVGLDNLSTGTELNLNEVQSSVSQEQWSRFKFVKGDICNPEICLAACNGIDYVLHQAALGSVPRSISDPITTNASNIAGFLNMLVAAKDSKVQSFTYAASSSSYGDHPALPKEEDTIGNPLSPYAVTKLVNELYADVFFRAYNFKSIGLRYFNVFGRRQDPDGDYAAVIPKWIDAMIQNQDVFINGDGETSRDFCFVENVVQANILAATASDDKKNEIYNIAVGGRTSLNKLFSFLREVLADNGIIYTRTPVYRSLRVGDVRHSQASIIKANSKLGYIAEFKINDGIKIAMPWYVLKHRRSK